MDGMLQVVHAESIKVSLCLCYIFHADRKSHPPISDPRTIGLCATGNLHLQIVSRSRTAFWIVNSLVSKFKGFMSNVRLLLSRTYATIKFCRDFCVCFLSS
jgi:hypothetical protein